MENHAKAKAVRDEHDAEETEGQPAGYESGGLGAAVHLVAGAEIDRPGGSADQGETAENDKDEFPLERHAVRVRVLRECREISRTAVHDGSPKSSAAAAGLFRSRLLL